MIDLRGATCRRVFAIALWVSVWGVAEAAETGEKASVPRSLQFSPVGNDLGVPSRRSDNSLEMEDLEMLDRQSSLGGVVERSASQSRVPLIPYEVRSSATASRRWETERNWLSMGAASSGRGSATIEEAFGVRDSDSIFGVLGSESKSVAGKRARADARGASSGSTRVGFDEQTGFSSLEYAPRVGGGNSLDPVLDVAVGSGGAGGGILRRPSVGIKRGFDFPSAPAPELEPGVTRSSGLGAVIGAGVGERSVPRTVRELIEGTQVGGMNQGERLLFPSETDEAGQPLNPVLPRRSPEGLEMERGLPKVDALGPGMNLLERSPYAGGTSPLRELTGKVMGPSSLAPAVPSLNTEPLRIQHKPPGMAELPSRRF